ncbi:hypothetical protein GIV47_21745 [Pseudomonas marginalis]|uniref:hypothetical protein n=1 Tax=Pseudomonas marginalis TaxID=298 RepID=UPI001F358EC8|nr:hypothetical protein [Pseudomonas marginalis]MCF5667578.1 hypothetical protein [Pseudomonas marginalis]
MAIYSDEKQVGDSIFTAATIKEAEEDKIYLGRVVKGGKLLVLESLVHPEDYLKVGDKVNACFSSNGGVWEYEYVVVKDQKYPLEFTVLPVAFALGAVKINYSVTDSVGNEGVAPERVYTVVP